MPTRPLDRYLVEQPEIADLEFGRVVVNADVVYNGLGMPRGNGAVTIQRAPGGSTIIDVSSQARAESPLATSFDGGFALSPPVVNAHTHLDLSDLPYEPSGYTQFIERVIAHTRNGLRGLAAAQRGVAELKSVGVHVIGDIVTDPAAMTMLLADTDLSGVAYWEVLAPDPADAETVFAHTVERVNAFRAKQRPGGVRVGLSPHTPHTVSAPLLKRLVAWAYGESVPLAIHVAETPAETELHLDGSGELARSLAAAGAPFAATGVSPVRYLDDLGVLAARPTLIHMVNVDEDDVRRVGYAGAPVVHCPRSNEALNCGLFPYGLFVKHAVDVAFGTDSHGSSPDLDVTAEVVRALDLHGAIANPRALVRSAVKNGYRAVGLTPPQVLRGAPANELVQWY